MNEPDAAATYIDGGIKIRGDKQTLVIEIP
jgi:hypothetical protein